MHPTEHYTWANESRQHLTSISTKHAWYLWFNHGVSIGHDSHFLGGRKQLDIVPTGHTSTAPPSIVMRESHAIKAPFQW